MGTEKKKSRGIRGKYKKYYDRAFYMKLQKEYPDKSVTEIAQILRDQGHDITTSAVHGAFRRHKLRPTYNRSAFIRKIRFPPVVEKVVRLRYSDKDSVLDISKDGDISYSTLLKWRANSCSPTISQIIRFCGSRGYYVTAIRNNAFAEAEEALVKVVKETRDPTQLIAVFRQILSRLHDEIKPEAFYSNN